jgi:hypothetical protein
VSHKVGDDSRVNAASRRDVLLPCLMNLASKDHHLWRCLDSQLYPAGANLDHFNFYRIANQDGFSLPPLQD